MPGDIDQTCRTLPLDNSRFRLLYAGRCHDPRGVDADYTDITRDGGVLPFDITVWRLRYDSWLCASVPEQPQSRQSPLHSIGTPPTAHAEGGVSLFHGR